MAVVYWQADAIGAYLQERALPEAVRIVSVYLFVGNIFRLNYLYMQGTADIKDSQLYQNLQNLLKLGDHSAPFLMRSGPSRDHSGRVSSCPS